MKKFLFVILLTTYYLLHTTYVNAATPTPTPTTNSNSSDDALNQQITDLKTRIASRVAELNLVEKRGIIARVTEVSGTQITVSDLKEKTRFIDVDELTRFSNPSTTESFGISDIAVGNTIGILGLYNKESRRILARFVNVVSLPIIIHGVIESVDEKLFRVKVISENEKVIYLDVEKTTITFSYSKEKGLVRSGFSKIKGNERIIAIVQTNTDEENLITATRIILLPEISKDPKQENSAKK